MSGRASLKDRRAAAAAMATDKFVGLVEKPGGGSGGGGAAGRGAPSDATPAAVDPSIRSSSLDAPFGQASSARSAKSSAARPNANASHDRIFIHARRTGQLTMDNMSLQSVPSEVCRLYDEDVLTAGEKIWETVDLLSVSMQHNALQTLPSAMATLVHLQVLLLAHNALQSLPDDLFSSLVALKKLDVSHNALRTLPASLGSLASLVELNVASNPSLSAFPDSLCDLARLEVLSAESCDLQQLPADIGCLGQLIRLNVNGNKLTALPPGVGELRMLRSLEAKGNRIQSASAASASAAAAPSRTRAPALPTGIPSLAALSSLTLLDLSANGLSSIPELPSSSRALAQVLLGFNQITSAEPLLVCRGLVVVNLNNNRLEILPRSLGLPSATGAGGGCTLKILDASNNDLADVPGELGLVTSLNKVLLEGNPLRKFPRGKLQGGQGIEAFKKYLVTRIDASSLAALSAAGSDDAAEALGDAGTTATSSNPSIESALRAGASAGRIDLSKITPPLTSFPATLLNLPSVGEIASMDLSNQRIGEGDLPSQIASFRRLSVFVAANMGWKELPLAICGLVGLHELTLTGNALTTLPRALGVLTSLSRVELRQNKFEAFPQSLLSLARTLTHIGLASNPLRSLPADFCTHFADRLEQLDVSGCQLTALPDGWRWMNPRFESLNAENNHIASVPLELGLLPGLRTLQLHGNPQRTVLYAVLAKGTPAILAALKNKIPSDSELLDPSVQRPRPATPEDPNAIDIDTSQRGEYARSMNERSRAAAASASYDRGSRRDDERGGYDRREAPAQASFRSGRGEYDNRDDRDDRRSSHEFPQRPQQHQEPRRDYEDDRSRGDPRYAAPAPRGPPAASSYRQSQPQYRDDEREYRHDDRSQQPTQQRMQREPTRSQAPPQQQPQRGDGRSQQFGAPPSARVSAPSASSSLAAELAQLNATIAALSLEIGNNMSLGGPRKLLLKKELASAMAERNRKQAQQ